MVRIFVPDYVIEDVQWLTPAVLAAMGIRGLLLDIDCTLKPYRAVGVSPAVRHWAETLRQDGVGMYLVSNARGKRVEPIAADLALPWIAPAWKPLPFALWWAIRKLRQSPKAVAMVGDQIFADVLAARLAGVRSILVRPILPGEEPWWSRWKRPLERLVLGADTRLVGKAGAGFPGAQGNLQDISRREAGQEERREDTANQNSCLRADL
ncbi:MAG: YqeG family HAD IIIA-type phosphatase [Thermoguttaceae bacterium]|nr:YqeG family HAD IIIA-type phosphatase [Thermoguttaceae bacterium]MDW8077878.1 YqeG family HAD IIIA-type phosphatase [Thermoguttaceae bacterium]